ncbi:hypothetical protein AVEN_233536-1 [Araneus ventricosus]|uniref:Uncharacterized protein n=1 Tax=Araneus ventricosus TaxID=182803 RepID=A0A4Y2NDT7_ARAVE|nr:hypothetical protein AVEN_233536-1 [Araneus ventricosus]
MALALRSGRNIERYFNEEKETMRSNQQFSETLYPNYLIYKKDVMELESQNKELEGELNSLPISSDANCYGRSVRNNDKIRKAKNLDNREKDFISPQRRKTARQIRLLKVLTKSKLETISNLLITKLKIRKQILKAMLNQNKSHQ